MMVFVMMGMMLTLMMLIVVIKGMIKVAKITKMAMVINIVMICCLE